MLRIVPYPHPALRYVSVPVTRVDDAFRDATRAMFDLMYEAKGIGLAANQVGLPFRFFVLNLTADPQQKDQEQVFINPEIVKKFGSDESEEGCLSFPGLFAKVRRSKKIHVKGYDLEGRPIELEAENLHARAIQHEADHLRGKLFVDLLNPLGRFSAAKTIKDFERSYRLAQAVGEWPSDAEAQKRLQEMAAFGSVAPAQPQTA